MDLIVPYKFSYLVGTVIFFIPWLILFIHRKDVRQEMLFMGTLFALGSALSAYLWWTIDWWHPPTITETRVGIEDLLLGFSNGGIAAVLYEEIFRKRLYIRSKNSHKFGLEILLLLFFFIISVLFWIFHLTSFVASSIGMVILGIILIYLRRDLFISSFINGLLMTLVSMPVYFILIFVSPGWIERVWDFQKISGIMVAGIPAEDLIFYFLFGFLIAPLYEYWKGEYLRRVPSR